MIDLPVFQKEGTDWLIKEGYACLKKVRRAIDEIAKTKPRKALDTRLADVEINTADQRAKAC